MMMPLIQDSKIWLPTELRDTPDMRELVHELKHVTYEGFTSTHDDGCDLLSQLILMDVVAPPKIFSNKNVVSENGLEEWDEYNRIQNNINAYESYLDN
jgi:hypothetical protein